MTDFWHDVAPTSQGTGTDGLAGDFGRPETNTTPEARSHRMTLAIAFLSFRSSRRGISGGSPS